MKKIYILTFLAAAFAAAAMAQNETKLVVKPTGRILMDGGLFDSKEFDEQFTDGFAIPDARVGVKATYGKWKAKVDIGYKHSKVGLKDICLEYGFDKHNLIRMGYFVHQFGLQSATSSSFKETMEEPQSNNAFFNGRLLGAMYVHSANKYFGTLSFFTEGDAMKMSSDKLGNQAVGTMSRLIYRPLTEDGRLFHIGISGAYEMPRYNKDKALDHSSYVLKTPYPTRICNVTAQNATIDHAKGLYKFSPEMVAVRGRVGLMAQYFWLRANRKDDHHHFTGSGAYAVVRGLLKGENYQYTMSGSGIATPRPGSMELAAGYNYTDLTDDKAQVYGGYLNDFSLTFNWYLNKYMIWRVRGSYTKVTGAYGAHELAPNNHMSLIETRLQIKF